MCDCDEAIREFEVNQLHKVLGVKSVKGQVIYAVKLHGQNGISFIDSNECVDKWAPKILNFLENAITFRMPATGINQNPLTAVNQQFAVGLPARVVSCTDVRNKIEYLCEWTNGYTRKLIPGSEHYELIIIFLESNIDFAAPQSSIPASSFRGKNFTVFDFD